MLKSKDAAGQLLALICVILWGTSFIVSKDLMQTVTPVQLMWLRFILAYVMLWLLHPVWRFHLKEEAQFLVISLFANTLYFLAENTALHLTQTANVSILVTTSPIITAILLRIFCHGEPLSRRKLMGFAIAFLGVIFVVLNGVMALDMHPVGDLLAITAAFFWAIYGILVRRCNDRFNSFLITRKLMFYGILTSTPLLLADEPVSLADLLTLKSVMALLYLGFICSALCYLMWNYAIKQIGALKTNLYMYAVPLVTLLAGALFLKERITLMGAVGIALVLAGMVFSTLPEKNIGKEE